MERLGKLLHKFDEIFGPNWFTVLFTNAFALFFIVALVWIGGSIGSDFHARLLNYMLIILGALLGWALGMFFAPYGKNDKEALAQMSKLASVFFTGYAVSKFDRFIEASVFVDKVPDPDGWIRVGLFAGATLLSILTVVTNRMYFRPDPRESEEAPVTTVASVPQENKEAQAVTAASAPAEKPSQSDPSSASVITDVPADADS